MLYISQSFSRYLFVCFVQKRACMHIKTKDQYAILSYTYQSFVILRLDFSYIFCFISAKIAR